MQATYSFTCSWTLYHNNVMVMSFRPTVSQSSDAVTTKYYQLSTTVADKQANQPQLSI